MNANGEGVGARAFPTHSPLVVSRPFRPSGGASSALPNSAEPMGANGGRTNEGQ